MKKRITAILVLTLVLASALAGCNGKVAGPVKDLAKSPEGWVLENNNTFTSCGYGVTDLDQNGLPEIISDYTDETTKLVNTNFSLVDNEGNVTECVHESAGEEFENSYFDEAVIYGSKCYYNSDTGEYFYTFTRNTRPSKAEKWEQVIAFSLKGNVITEELVASEAQVYDIETDEEVITYRDSKGNEIDEATYKTAVRDYFADLEEKDVSFGGFRAFDAEENEKLKSMSTSELEKILVNSLNKFVIK